MSSTLAAACGSSGAATSKPNGQVGTVADAGTDEGAVTGADGGSSFAASGGVLGVWQIAGSDARDAYTGQLELRDAGGGKCAAIRIVKYTTTKVEDNRDLWWVWTGTGTLTSTTASIDVLLTRADFVASRAGVVRTAADQIPLAIAGSISLTESGAVARWSGDGIAENDAMSDRIDSTKTPIFAVDRELSPVNSAPTAAAKAAFDSAYASYRALPSVAPSVGNPAFEAGVLYTVTDKTDYDFYQANPNAIRVVDKIIDAPSLGETAARASAYRSTLNAKASAFDLDVPANFIEPATGMLVDSVTAGKQNPSGDGALWTASYIASQAYRYLATASTQAIANIAKSVTGIQILLEITPDRTTFARTIRAGGGSETGGWHAGVGAYAAYDWLEGGNNDMLKGLYYGSLTGYLVLCDPVISGQEALCARIRTNAAHMLADLSLTQSTSDSNHLMAAWLSAYVNGSASDLAKAVESWALLSSSVEQADFQERVLATADWSGTHLTFVEMASMRLLASRRSLPGFDTNASVQKGIETMRSNFQVFRLGLWSVLFATLTGTPQTIDVDNARWRLREFSQPKSQLNVDHRISADFVMSPYPDEPWKNDWTTTDRTESLYGYPLFEMPIDVYAWRSGPFDYHIDTEDRTSPGADYLHAYWIGRYLGLLTAAE